MTTKLIYRILLFILIAKGFDLFAQSNWIWAASGGKTGIDASSNASCGGSVAFGQNNNTYLIGRISSPAKIGNLLLNSYGYEDVFIVKYDGYGNPLWAKTAGGKYRDMGKSIIYAPDGYLYVCGFFHDTAYFDNTIIPGIYTSLFFAKLDTNGNYVWIKHVANADIHGSMYHPTLSLYADHSNHIYLAGYCTGTTSLIDTVYTGNPPFTSVFVTQLDTSGHANWTRFIKGSAGGVTDGNLSLDLTIDQYDNLIYTAAIPRNDTITGGSSNNIFYEGLGLGKMSNSGNIIWQKEFGDSSIYLWGAHPRAVSLDANNNIYLCGTYYKDFLLDSSVISDNYGGFIAKFNSADGQLINAKSYSDLSGSTVTNVSGCDYDFNGHVLYSGTIYGTVDFGGIIVNGGGSFVANYDTSGILNWVVTSGNGSGYNFSTASFCNGGMYAITGFFQDNVFFDPFALQADTLPSSSTFYFVATMATQQNPNLIKVPNSNIYFNIYPNPTSEELRFETTQQLEQYEVDIISSESRLIMHYENLYGNHINIADLPSGIYFIRLKKDQITVIKRFVKLN